MRSVPLWTTCIQLLAEIGTSAVVEVFCLLWPGGIRVWREKRFKERLMFINL